MSHPGPRTEPPQSHASRRGLAHRPARFRLGAICGLGAAAAALVASAAAAAPARLEVTGHVRAAPPGAPVMAGYLTLRNPGRRSVAITGAASPAFARVEVHRTVMRDGVARMEPVQRLEVPAGGTVRMAPGGMHLMLIRPRRALRPGETVRVVLRFAEGAEQAVTLPVRRGGMAGMEDGHHHDGPGH